MRLLALSSLIGRGGLSISLAGTMANNNSTANQFSTWTNRGNRSVKHIDALVNKLMFLEIDFPAHCCQVKIGQNISLAFDEQATVELFLFALMLAFRRLP